MEETRWGRKGRRGGFDDAKVSEYRMRSPGSSEEEQPEASEFSMVGLDRWKG